MIRAQIASRGIADPRVIEAFRSVPRELFVPPSHRLSAYDDTPLPLDRGQTISQPFIVAYMTEVLQLRGNERVLEIGTGSGYQTAILAKLVREVFSAELEADLARGVQARLDRLGITNVHLGIGDGTTVFREFAPFHAILSAAAPLTMPPGLLDQLADGGRCVIPLGGIDAQYLWMFERRGSAIVPHQLEAVRFVPLRSVQ